MSKKFDCLCNDELNTVINFLPLIDIFSMRLLNKYYDKFIDEDLALESYVHKKVNAKIIKKYGKYLEKIIIDCDSSFSDELLKYCKKIAIFHSPYNSDITDEELKYISGVQKLILEKNNKITDNGLEYIPNIMHLSLDCNKNITDNGLKYIPNIQKLYLLYNRNITDTLARNEHGALLAMD